MRWRRRRRNAVRAERRRNMAREARSYGVAIPLGSDADSDTFKACSN